MALTKVSGGILDPGINVAGIVTATGFDGPFTGGSSKNITAGVVTATSLDLNGNGDISGNLVIGGNLTANGDFTTLNTTLREVEILRVDAQDDNVAAGIITQRGTGNILDLYDTSSAVFSVRDGGNIIMGTGAGSVAPHAPLHIRTGTTGAITTLLKLHGPFTSNTGSEGTAIDFGTASDTSTGARIIGSREAAGAKGALRFCTGRENDAGFNDGHMVIDETGNVGIASASPGHRLDVNGTIRSHINNPSLYLQNIASSGAYTNRIFFGDGSTFGKGSILYEQEAGGENYLRFKVGGNTGNNIERLTIQGSGTGNVGIGSVIPSAKLDVIGNTKLQGNLNVTGQFHMGGTPGWTYASQKFVVVEPSNPLGMILQGNNANQGVNLTLQNINNTVNAYSDISFADDGGQIFGAIRGKVIDRDNNHGEIQFHTSSGSLGQQVTIDKDGNVIIGTSTWQYKKPLNVQGESGSILSLYNGDTTSYAANTYSAIELKILTGNTGNTFGALEIRGIKEEGTNGNNARALTFYTGVNGGTNQERFRITSDGMLKIERGSASDTALEINTTATSNACRIKFNESGSNKAQIAYSHDNDRLELVSQSGNGIAIYSGGNLVWKFDTNGHLLPNSAGAVNIGSSSTGIGNVYLAEQKVLNLEPGGAFKLYRGAGGGGATNFVKSTFGSISVEAASGVILKVNNTHDAVAAYANDRVDIHHANNIKLTTTTTGISVTGEVAASQNYPDFKPALDLNFSLTKKLDPRITFTRNGLASFVDENGDLKYSTNAPRFDHDPITKECKGLLMEASKANLLLYSNQMNGGGGRTLENNTTDVVAPDGTNTAIKMISSTNGYAYAFAWNQSPTDSSRVGKRLSYWVKKGDYDLIDLTNGYMLQFTFSTKSFTNSGSKTWREKVEEYPNDWYRVSYTIPSSSSNDTLIGRAGSTSGNTIAYFWGFQLEEDGYETSYIPTDGASVTRAAESAVIDGEDFNEFFSHNGVEFNDYRGTLISFSESESYANLVAARYNKVQLELNNDNKVSLAIVGHSSSPYVQGMISYGSSTQIDGTSSGSTFPDIVKHGIAFAKNSGVYTYNGNTVQTDNSMNVANSSLKYTQLTIGGNPSKTHLKRIIYYTNRISDTQLRNLTS